MGKRGSNRGELGRKKQANVSAKTMLKLDHAKDLALWAGGEASIPSLGAFFGHRLAASAEALGVPPDPSLFLCQRCETVLQPGFNCTIRIEKNKTRPKHRINKPFDSPKNNVVYTCHFCSYRNLKRGTPSGYMQELLLPTKKVKPKTPLESKIPVTVSDNVIKTVNIEEKVVTTPTLLDSKRKKRGKSGIKKPIERELNSDTKNKDKEVVGSSKRRRKSWTSLKEITETSKSQDLNNSSIPFLI